MQSKNKPAPRAVEQRHIELVKALSCGVCDLKGPNEVHEIKQGQWFTSIPLCPDCHRGLHNGLHGRMAIWKVKKLDELDVLAATIERLYGT